MFTNSFGTSYLSPSASTIRKRLIPIKAVRVALAAENFLRTCWNLTISFDGSKMRRKIGFYSVHVITANGRSYLVALDDASRLRHTTEYIAKLIKKVCLVLLHDVSLLILIPIYQTMHCIGSFRFITVVSDNTGNTCKARHLIHLCHVQVINVEDCCC